MAPIALRQWQDGAQSGVLGTVADGATFARVDTFRVVDSVAIAIDADGSCLALRPPACSAGRATTTSLRSATDGAAMDATLRACDQMELREEQVTEREVAGQVQAGWEVELAEAEGRIARLEKEAAAAACAHDRDVTGRMSAEEAAGEALDVAEEASARALEATATTAAVREQYTAVSGQLAEARADAERAAAAATVEHDRSAAEVAAVRAQLVEGDRARAARGEPGRHRRD